MYQRFSAHLNSVEIPDLSELKETARETASRVESALSRGSSTDSKGATGNNLSRTSSVSNPPIAKSVGRSLSLTSSNNITSAVSKKDEQQQQQKAGQKWEF